MKVVVIPEPVLQPDITKEDMDLKWNLLKELPEVDELVIKHFDGYPSNEELHPIIADADAAIGVWVNGSNINEEFLSKHPNLKYVATLGHGFGEFDVPMTKEKGDGDHQHHLWCTDYCGICMGTSYGSMSSRGSSFQRCQTC